MTHRTKLKFPKPYCASKYTILLCFSPQMNNELVSDKDKSRTEAVVAGVSVGSLAAIAVVVVVVIIVLR